ncbi:helix-turn-helix domain-containing protein [Mycobacterium malmoense]|uniref:helix-turn-helix domain-containing protein n=1 Tax=Mycobacterium malmoense TaxID=1780 RepID=UPI000ACF6A6B|nr:helix-turn-helix domain-containing protein [Mycobacterium malmoense]QZA16579.1 helix-turn-helix domain-containing protein [Mycobacterium malmoense]UNB93381.1 helix-turn-helix domain-containing protein [Mycobacterium malmoense]
MPEKSRVRSNAQAPRKTKPAPRSSLPEIARIGQAFAGRRLQLGLTQQLLADLSGVSRYSVQALEYGTGSVKLASLVEIAETLGLRLEVNNFGDATHSPT